MLVCIVWAGVARFVGSPIFLPEALALEFFAFSWLTKGRAGWTLHRVLRHPGQAIAKLHHAIHGDR